MDVEASRELAARLAGWPGDAERAIALIAEAQLLSDLPIGAVAVLDSVGSDGRTMAAAIRRAADALESFSISLDSPYAIAAAVADVRNFRGSDNAPELDARLRTLRSLVDAHTSSPGETAQVMARLLAADQSIDPRLRDLTKVDEARAELERVLRLEGTGAVGANDSRVDDAVRALGAALGVHAESDAQQRVLLGAFVDPDNASVASATLLASELTGRSIGVVAAAHEWDVDYDRAEAQLGLDRVDRLTTTIGTSMSVARIREASLERRDLLIRLGGSSDPRRLAALTEQLDDLGRSAVESFAGLEGHLARRERIEIVGAMLGLDERDARTRLDEMIVATDALVARGWGRDDASGTVQLAAQADLHLEAIEAAATERDLSLWQGAGLVAQARALDVSLGELDAYLGFREYFGHLDVARGGAPDGVVSIFDLAHVANHPDEFADEVVAAAMGVLASSGLRNRLDTARDNDDVIGHESFGSDRAGDQRFSFADLESFHFKQTVNFVLVDHLDAIDVAAQGGDASLIDGQLRKEDFEAYLGRADELGLDESARMAIRTVIDADWYDKDFWDEHGDTMAFVAGVVAGGAVVVLSGGTGIVLLTVSATAAGAGAGAGLTLTENALSGDPLGDGLVLNTIMGASGGLFAAGFAGGGSTSLPGRMLAHTSNGASAVSNGVADPLLAPLVDDATLDEIHAGARTVNYLAGAGSVALTGVGAVNTSIGAGRTATLLTDDGIMLLDDVLYDVRIDGVQRLVGASLDGLSDRAAD